jgi:hypothetical protein
MPIRSAYNKFEDYKYLLTFTFILLVVGHLMLSNIVPNRTFNFVGFVIIFLVLLEQNILQRSAFGFVMVIYIASHFIYTPAYGGAFNVIAFILVGIAFLTKKANLELEVKDPLITVLVFILLASNVVGWIFQSPLRFDQVLLGVISFLGYIFMFQVSRRLLITPERFRGLIYLFIFMSGYTLMTALNSALGFIGFHSPLILRGDAYLGSSFYVGMIGRASGEIGLLTFLVLLPLLLTRETWGTFRINKNLVILGILSAILLGMISFTKTVFALLILGLLTQFLLIYVGRARAFDKKINFISYGFTIIIFLLLVAPLVNLGFIFQRFAEYPNMFADLANDLLTAKGTSREQSFLLGYNRLLEKPWIFGYGWAAGQLNRFAWFDDPEKFDWKYDFHSLYYSLPPVFGWIGTIAFFLLILSTIYRLWKITVRSKYNPNYLTIPAFCFIFLWIFFLFNEYSMSVLTEPHYFMMNWIWLGLANSIIQTYKLKFKNKPQEEIEAGSG